MRIIIDTDDTPAFASAGDAYHVEGWPYDDDDEQKYREHDDRIFRRCREGHGDASLFLTTPVNVRVIDDDGSERQAKLLGYTPFDTEGVDDIVMVLHERDDDS